MNGLVNGIVQIDALMTGSQHPADTDDEVLQLNMEKKRYETVLSGWMI